MTRVLLFHNPWAKLPYKGMLTALPQKIPQKDDTINDVPGKLLHELLGIPDGWLKV